MSLYIPINQIGFTERYDCGKTRQKSSKIVMLYTKIQETDKDMRSLKLLG